MSLDLDARQRALLEHMGVRLDFLPPLHERTAAPFVIVSAARMTPESVEAELFGVEEIGRAHV